MLYSINIKVIQGSKSNVLMGLVKNSYSLSSPSLLEIIYYYVSLPINVVDISLRNTAFTLP